MEYVLACDIGSSSCKTALFDRESHIVDAVQQEYPTFYPKPGWVEQHPDDWYRSFCETTRLILERTGVDPARITAVGFIGVTHNAVLLDKDDQPLGPCILLFDSRSASDADRLMREWGGSIIERTLNTTSSMWTWPQLEWIKRNEPERWKRMRRILFQKDYVRHRLAPSPVTDWIDAHGSSLYDPRSQEWIPEFLAILGLPREFLPEPLAPTARAGTIGAQGAADTSLCQGTPVIAGTTDTVAELLGSGAVLAGDAIVKLASVGRIAVVSEKPLIDPAIINYRHILPGLWYPGTSCKHAASAYRWLRDVLWPAELRGDPEVYEKMNREAELAPAGCDGLLFHPHLTGQWAPYFDERMRASFTGISSAHGRGHFIRSVLEGVAFALRDAFKQMEACGLQAGRIRLIGQGARGVLWRRIIANTLGREVSLPVQRDAVFGAGLITAMGAGFLPLQADAVLRRISFEETVAPDPDLANYYSAHFSRYKAADSALRAMTGG
jgi:xylulokinase